MGEKVNIDTKYAKRDIKRMETAITELGNVKKSYQSVINCLSNSYKGNASSYLQEQISTVKIKRINNMIDSIKTAKKQLNTAIKLAEQTSKNVTNSMKG